MKNGYREFDSGRDVRVCIIGDFNDSSLDEGMKNVAFHLAENISSISNMEVLRVNNTKISLRALKQMKQFQPQVLHYVPGLTNVSIIFLKAMEWYLDHPKIFVSAIFPGFNDSVYKLSHLRPDCVFAPSSSIKERMDSLATAAKILPNGVDIEKFVPASADQKEVLREKYRLHPRKFTILHVGHLQRQRHLDQLLDLSTANQVVVVTGSYLKTDATILRRLRAGGCIVFQGYFPHIEEFYQLSDCYVFPIQHTSGSVLCPLSVMEAMACNLPVVTANVNGIGTFFEAGRGLTFATEKEDFCHAVQDIKAGKICSATREQVQRYTWQNVAKTIANVYLESFSNSAV